MMMTMVCPCVCVYVLCNYLVFVLFFSRSACRCRLFGYCTAPPILIPILLYSILYSIIIMSYVFIYYYIIIIIECFILVICRRCLFAKWSGGWWNENCSQMAQFQKCNQTILRLSRRAACVCRLRHRSITQLYYLYIAFFIMLNHIGYLKMVFDGDNNNDNSLEHARK